MRLTHWLFVFCIALSWWTAEENVMDWHRYSGYALLGLLVFRIYWGFAGSSSARFSNFLSGPRGIVATCASRARPIAMPATIHSAAGASPCC